MSRRILPLVVVLTIALGPIAVDVCQVACADHAHGPVGASPLDAHHRHAEADHAAVAHHQGHHAAQEAPAGATRSRTLMRGVAHSCRHGEGLPAFVGTSLPIAPTAAAAVQTPFALPALASGFRLGVAADSVVHSPPIALTTPLRV